MENQAKSNSLDKLQDFYDPYVVKTSDEIKEACELCQSLPCCPEHCCNVSHE